MATKTLVDEDTAQTLRNKTLINAVFDGGTMEPHGSVTSFGAIGDGVADDTEAIRDAIAAVPNGGVVYFPAGRYLITDTIDITTAGIQFMGAAGYSAVPSAPVPYSVIIADPSLAAPMFSNTVDFAGGVGIGAYFQNLGFIGSSLSGSKGIYGAWWRELAIRDCTFNQFGDQAIHCVGGTGGYVEHVWVQRACLVRDRADYVGGVDWGAFDSYLHAVTSTCSVVDPETYGDGFIAGICIRAANAQITNCIGHFSELGIVLTTDAVRSRMIGCRADFNMGEGFKIDASVCEIIGNLALKNSREGDALHSGFVTTGGWNTFVANQVSDLVESVRQNHGFVDSNASALNRYSMNRVLNIRGDQYSFTNGTKPTADFDDDGVFRLGAGAMEIGDPATVASAGAIRLPNLGAMSWRNAAGDGDIQGFYVDQFDQIVFSSNAFRVVVGSVFAPSPTATHDLGANSLRFRDLYLSQAVRLGAANIFVGTGGPDGVVAAAVGSLFLRTDGGTSTTLYVKETGAATSSGWVAK